MTLRATLFISLLTAYQGLGAATISITCNGLPQDIRTGRPVSAKLMVFGFRFDPQAQTMELTEGGETKNEPLAAVSITDTLAKGSMTGKYKYAFEINRIEGTATMRSTDIEAQRLGLNAASWRGNCAIAGQAKF